MEQFQLFSISPVQVKGPLAQRFEAFHLENPHVLHAILGIALGLRDRGIERVGMSLIFERLRWLYMIQTSGEGEYRLNNSYRAFYARLAMAVKPRLQGMFSLRVQADDWSPDELAARWYRTGSCLSLIYAPASMRADWLAVARPDVGVHVTDDDFGAAFEGALDYVCNHPDCPMEPDDAGAWAGETDLETAQRWAYELLTTD